MLMQPSMRKSQPQLGFTLLELLVVVVIVAILFTYTTLAIRSDSPEDLIKKEALKMERLVQLALEEAILRGEEYAIEVNTDSYRILHFFNNRWTPLTDDKILAPRELPQDMELEMTLEDTEIVIAPGSDKKTGEEMGLSQDSEETSKEKKLKLDPQIFLLSSGEITPEFNIRFYILGIENSYLVTGQFDGSVTARKSEI